MLTQHIAIVPTDAQIRAADLARVSAAIQKQVIRDLAPIWSIRATVDAFPSMDDVPVGYWPVFVTLDEVAFDGAVQLDERGQPYGTVRADVDSTRWSLTASRVCMELLVNPFGDRRVTAPSLRSDQAMVEFLVDIWGPCADASHSYFVNELAVSDFCTPAFFGHVAGGGIDRCSFRGIVPLPLQVPRGGHLTWYDPRGQAWWVRNHWGDNPVDVEWSLADRRSTAVREWIRTQRVRRPTAPPPPLPDRRSVPARLAAREQAAEPPTQPAEDLSSAEITIDLPLRADEPAPPALPVSPHSTLAPVAIAAPPVPVPGARHGLSLLGGAVAGALLVVFVLGRQDAESRSATSGREREPLPVLAAPVPTVIAPEGTSTAITPEATPQSEPRNAVVPTETVSPTPSRPTSRQRIGRRTHPSQVPQEGPVGPSEPAQAAVPVPLPQPVEAPRSSVPSFDTLADTRD